MFYSTLWLGNGSLEEVTVDEKPLENNKYKCCVTFFRTGVSDLAI